ncbi:DUF3768 domain-containing protein [Deinococcus detaillensis]|uniref:DUF3768 domain-containing protein n=1 Tax=Deinococcus detaillensis TaxID=2592048 RepID=A0A553UH45_9DEIO|nr:DUF3768 domain-containing protein [Deinococcus detaillensis]
MTTPNTKRIAELNELCRRAPGLAGRLYLTEGVAALPACDQSAICEKAQRFENFTPDNDPYGEHDFGALTHSGEKIF